ncbi:glycerol channel, variant 2 [Basidiobolus ranarum]|uniref:Glycerol channel, variant 2 n=1 Tax=Basidiobolus ranarum TaxID=34480 RepID=A0ABR2WMC6_9FUNG
MTAKNPTALQEEKWKTSDTTITFETNDETIKCFLNESPLLKRLATGESIPWLSKFRLQYREYLAEYFGTLLLVSLGLSVIHQVTLNKGTTGTFLSVNLGWGFGLTLALLISGRISGGHLNPAVTIAVALIRGMRWSKACGYIIAQLMGAFSGAALVYLYFCPLILAYENGVRQVGGERDTAGLYASYQNPAISTFSAFVGEFLATGVLIIGIFTATDKRNNIPSYCVPFIIGLTVISIGISLGK